jgi:hypothetical protein
MLARALFVAVLAVFIQIQPSVAQELSFQDLRQRVIDGVNRNMLPVNEPKFDWSGDYMIYTIKPSCEITPQSDPTEYPFNELLTVAAIRKHRFGSRRARDFWERQVFPQVEREINGMVNDINNRQLEGVRLTDRLADSSVRISEIYNAELDALAKREGKRGVQTPCSEPALYMIKVRPVPDRAIVKYMRSGAYLLHKCFKGREPEWTDTKWETAPLNGDFTIGEKTRFWVVWNDRPQESQSGLISAKQGGGGFVWTLVVSPSAGFRWEQ